jgi:chromosome transmission fidelity protein 18
MGNLLTTPIHRLMDELSATTAQRLMHPDTDPSTSSDHSSSRTEDTLWVDRYRPKRFTDLLGDERVHREVLAWVKQWDLCVFGKGKGKRRARDVERFMSSEDELGRPQEKVRVLREAGLPGLTIIDIAIVWTSWTGEDDTCACCGYAGGVQCLRNQCQVCFFLR